MGIQGQEPEVDIGLGTQEVLIPSIQELEAPDPIQDVRPLQNITSIVVSPSRNTYSIPFVFLIRIFPFVSPSL